MIYFYDGMLIINRTIIIITRVSLIRYKGLLNLKAQSFKQAMIIVRRACSCSMASLSTCVRGTTQSERGSLQPAVRASGATWSRVAHVARRQWPVWAWSGGRGRAWAWSGGRRRAWAHPDYVLAQQPCIEVERVDARTQCALGAQAEAVTTVG